jgi:acylphosphatase
MTAFYTPDMLVARRFLVSGRVHNVGFRFFVHEAARHEGVGGWVANLPDGRVEVLAEGDEEAVDRLERQIRRGPPAAHIARVDVVDDVPANMRGFEIRQ